MFDKKIAEKHLKKLLKRYNIHVYAWSKSSCGKAFYAQKRIKIPHPTNTDRFAVCMHEIKHIIDGKGKFSFEDEYRADKFALEQIQLLNFDGAEDWIKRMKFHVLSRIAMAHNRRLDHKNINKEIRDFFRDVDFKMWENNKVFVKHSKEDPRGYKIYITKKFSKEELERFLDSKELVLEKSEIDDSTYGRWVVRERSKPFGLDFDNLTAVAEHYSFR
jgi:hypothetical protein